MKSQWIFIIDTEQYSGNFERELAGWVTGQECGVGSRAEEAAKDAKATMPEEVLGWIEDNLAFRTTSEDPNGAAVAIWPTPGWFNHGMGECFRKGTDPEVVLADYRMRIHEYFDPQLARAQAKVEAGEIAWATDLRSTSERIAEAEALTKPNEYAAYLSVAIFFEEKPNGTVLWTMKERAKSFRSDIPITGFRMVYSKPEA